VGPPAFAEGFATLPNGSTGELHEEASVAQLRIKSGAGLRAFGARRPPHVARTPPWRRRRSASHRLAGSRFPQTKREAAFLPRVARRPDEFSTAAVTSSPSRRSSRREGFHSIPTADNSLLAFMVFLLSWQRYSWGAGGFLGRYAGGSPWP